MVADNESGKSVMSEVRTSSGMFLEKKQVSSQPPHRLIPFCSFDNVLRCWIGPDLVIGLTGSARC
jgi:hypothetical protein